MPYGIPNFGAALRDTVARQRRPRREVDPSEFEVPDSPAMEDFLRHSEETPLYEDHEQGFGGKFAAGLVGMAEGLNRGAGAGVRAGREVMDRKFVNALRSHAAQGDVLEQRAGLEEARNKMGLALRKERRLTERSNDELALQEEAHDIADRAEQRLGRALTVNDENADLDRASLDRRNTEDVGARKYAADQGIREAGIRASADRYSADQRLEGDKLQGFGRGAAGAEKIIPIGQQEDADRQAIEQVIRMNPKYMKFVDEIAGKEDSDFKGYRVMPGGTVPNESWNPFAADERDMTPEERLDFAAFMREVEDAKKKMFSTMVDPYANRGFGRGPR